MANGLDKLKRDFAKHRAKTVILGILAVVMAVFIVKAVKEMKPRTAVAENNPFPLETIADSTDTSVNTAERIRLSHDLWKTLRETRGIDAASAFKFDPTYFSFDPNRVIQPDPIQSPEKSVPRLAVNNEQLEHDAHVNGIREQARGLVVRSTVVGSGNSKPVAVINDRILTIGDRIAGFEITSIQAREVEFKKEGITLAVKMAEDSSAQ